MQARFRKIGPDGREVEVGDVTALADAVRTGAITPATLLYDAEAGRWTPAGDHDVVRAALAVASNTGRFTLPEPVPAPGLVLPRSAAAEAPAVPAPAQLEEEVERLAAFIGNNWRHYEGTFRRMLRAEPTGGNIGHTWNWAAFFLAPWWYMYRRQYGPFVVFGVWLWGASSVPHELNHHDLRVFALALPLAGVITQAWMADWLLFHHARQVLRANPDADVVRLAELGAPNNSAWLCGIGMVVLIVLNVIMNAA